MLPDVDLDSDGSDDLDFKRLTAEEVKILRHSSRPLSAWLVVGLQVMVGLVLALLVWVFTDSKVAGWSAAYGALAVA